MNSVTITNNEIFSSTEHCMLARMIFKRWGRDLDAALVAWRRLFQNSCSKERFTKMVGDETYSSFDDSQKYAIVRAVGWVLEQESPSRPDLSSNVKRQEIASRVILELEI